jgi:hypothetical protein
MLHPGHQRFKAIAIMAIPLSLSAFTHLWNPIGFPGVHYDEAIYIERGIRLLEGLGPQDPSWRYDHPFFAQIFLASVFSIIGYPHSLQPSEGDVQSVEMLYAVPRLLMGILAVFDTFLIYKIAESRYNRNVGLIASMLFAVMPLSWLERRVYLESIQLPFILSSILFSMYRTQNGASKRTNLLNNRQKEHVLSVALSGLFLGLAIFTKIPAVSLIPLVAFLVYSNSKSFKTVGFWFIPVILIPMIWPIYAASIGELDTWLDTERGVLWQTQRVGQPLYESMNSLFEIDPIMITIGTVGVLYAIMRRDIFPVLWILPLLIFVYLLQFVSFWHLIPLIPMFFIAGAILIVDVFKKVAKKDRLQASIIEYYERPDMTRKKLEQFGDFYLLYKNLKDTYDAARLRFNKQRDNQLALIFTAVISITGLIGTILLIQMDVNSAHFSTVAYLVQYLPKLSENDEGKPEGKITVVGSPRYFWIPRYVFDENFLYKAYKSTKPDQTETNVLIADRGFMNTLGESKLIQNIYSNSSRLATFNGSNANYNTKIYPYASLRYASPYPEIEIRTNHGSND